MELAFCCFHLLHCFALRLIINQITSLCRLLISVWRFILDPGPLCSHHTVFPFTGFCSSFCRLGWTSRCSVKELVVSGSETEDHNHLLVVEIRARGRVPVKAAKQPAVYSAPQKMCLIDDFDLTEAQPAFTLEYNLLFTPFLFLVIIHWLLCFPPMLQCHCDDVKPQGPAPYIL